MFLLFRKFLFGENIDRQIAWMDRHRMNTARVLGMVGWSGNEFGPASPNYWDMLPRFFDYMAHAGKRVEFTAFADAQQLAGLDQRAHIRRVHDIIGPSWNAFLEICNEPFKNGVVPSEIWSVNDLRNCLMAYGDYDPIVRQEGGKWIGRLKVLDYLTFHPNRDPQAFARKAKDILEMRSGFGDGSEERYAYYEGARVPTVNDEPIGVAEAATIGNRQRTNNADDIFWLHAISQLFGAGSTYHCDAGLLGEIPEPDSDQERCADAATAAWLAIPPEYQQGQYTRGGLSNLPLEWREEFFPDVTSRLYAMLLGNTACCVAVKPNDGWTAQPINGWRIVSQTGPKNSVVILERS